MKAILAVDDRKNSLKILSAILTDEGYRVIQATSAKMALEIYAGGTHIDAVLSDFKMPGMARTSALNSISHFFCSDSFQFNSRQPSTVLVNSS